MVLVFRVTIAGPRWSLAVFRVAVAQVGSCPVVISGLKQFIVVFFFFFGSILILHLTKKAKVKKDTF